MLKFHRNCTQRPVLILIGLASLGFLAGSTPAGEKKRPELRLQVGHADSVSSVALSMDGKRVLTGSGDATAILWDVETARPIQMFRGHSKFVSSVALSVDGKRVLTGSGDATAILWDVETAMPIRTFQGHLKRHLNEHTIAANVTSVAFSANGNRVITGATDSTAILWDVETAKPLHTFKDPNGIKSVAVSEDNKRVLTGGSRNETATLWNAETGKPIQTFKGQNKLPESNWVSVYSVALSADGKQVLTGLAKSAILWDADTAKPLQTFQGHKMGGNAVALSKDSKLVFTTGEDIAIMWDADTGKALQTFIGHTQRVTSLTLSGDQKRILTGSFDKSAILWDVNTASPARTFARNPDAVSSAALSGDGKRILTGSRNKIAVLWDVDTAKPLQTFDGHTKSACVALSGDGKRALTAEDGGWAGGEAAILWDVDTAKPIKTFKTLKYHAHSFLSLAISVDGKRIITGEGSNVMGGPSFCHAVLWDAGTAKPLLTFKGHNGWVYSVAMCRDGKHLLTGSADNTAMLWHDDYARPVRAFKGHTSAIYSVAMSADAKRVLTGSMDKRAILWDAESAQPIQTFKGHTESVRSVALSGDGKRVLTGSSDNTAILWDADTGKSIQTFKGHNREIRSVAWGPRDAFVISASLDATVGIWKPGRDEPVFSFLSMGEEWLFWTPEGYYTCSPNGEDLIAWKISDDSSQGYRIFGPADFRKKFYRPDMFRHLLRELDLDRALALADKESGRPSEGASNIAKVLPPTVVLVRPDRDGDIDQERITVEAFAHSVGDYPVARMRLQIDGRPYQGNLSNFEIPQPKLGKAKRTWDADLTEGDHTIQVIAENTFGVEGRSEILRIRRKAAVETLPRLFVLAVGISNYDKESLRKGVYYSAGDARKFADTVEASSKPLYREINVVRLLDQNATRKKILQELTQMRKQATQRDAVLIFFAGHGTRDDQNNFFFLPVEADLDELASTGLSEGDFKAAVKALPGRVVLLLDACHSGTLIENGRRSDPGLTDRLYRDLTSNEYGLVMMCSSRGIEISRESNELKGGLFTVAVVEGLKGKARKTDGAVYLKELDHYITERVRVLSDGRQHPLTSQPTTISNIPLTRP